MKTRLIGDIHGKIHEYKNLSSTKLNKGISGSIQLGDMGVGFGQSNFWRNALNSFMIENNATFIRGNHDNPHVSKEMPGYIPDGTIENDVMFIGGAWSIDWPNRLPGVDWWPDEELSYEELYRLHDVYSIARPRVMITHDAPTDVAYEMFVETGLAIGGKNAKKIQTRTGEALQSMFEAHQPDCWFFGHWHYTVPYLVGKTNFLCLGELDYIDVDLSDTDQMIKAIMAKEQDDG